jgi:uncharacterized protein YbjT (DUF2867 family)
MMSTILVTGGTGTLGRLLVPRLKASGNQVRTLSRKSHPPVDGVEYVTGDLASGEGVEAALAGAKIVVHCAGSAKGDEIKAHNLVKAASKSDVGHLVYISVVGADRVPIVSGVDRAMLGYFGSKFAAESLIANSGVPWTTLRATQFHELTFATVEQMSKLPIVPVPAGFRFQPIAGDEVAARLAELALGEPRGLVPDMAGPRAYPMADLIRGYLSARHMRRLLMSMRLPGKAAAAMRAGANLALDRAVGRRSWEDFLAERVGASGKSSPSLV